MEVLPGAQIARFEAESPEQDVRDALVDAGWLEPDTRLRQLGVCYLGEAFFTVDLPIENTRVIVQVHEQAAKSWLLTVEEKAIPRAGVRPTVSVNRRSRVAPATSGSRFLAKRSCFVVASAIHEHLSTRVTALRWALDHDPNLGPCSSVPVAPDED